MMEGVMFGWGGVDRGPAVKRHAGAVFLAAALACSGCAHSKKVAANSDAAGRQRSKEMLGSDVDQKDNQRCDASGENRVAGQYDTSGDQVPDVRKVYLRMGVYPDYRMILICREVDINQDGRKDIVRYYNDQGEPQREDVDRDLDGRMDELRLFQLGRTVQRQVDSDRDGRLDTKIFYRDGVVYRIERDTSGRSDSANWKPDRWEYVEAGQIRRIGVDVDGDGHVDLWERDEAVASADEKAAEAASAAVSPESPSEAAAPVAATPAGKAGATKKPSKSRGKSPK